jgi:DNA-binding protein HU-beta
MSLGKKDISLNISTKAHISLVTSNKILNSFLELVIENTKNSTLKISNFGTFYYKKSPPRTGRNPNTKEEFLISERSKLTYKSSSKVKNILN